MKCRRSDAVVLLFTCSEERADGNEWAGLLEIPPLPTKFAA